MLFGEIEKSKDARTAESKIRSTTIRISLIRAVTNSRCQRSYSQGAERKSRTHQKYLLTTRNRLPTI